MYDNILTIGLPSVSDENLQDVGLLEEDFTTLATTYLGDNLNALQALTQVRTFIEKTKDFFL